MPHTNLKGGKDGLPHYHVPIGSAGFAGRNSIRSQATGVNRVAHPTGGRITPPKEHTKGRRRRK
jgi:hypothetical protein